MSLEWLEAWIEFTVNKLWHEKFHYCPERRENADGCQNDNIWMQWVTPAWHMHRAGAEKN